MTGGDFWASHGETLTSAYMSLAGLSQLLPGEGGQVREPLTIGRLASWAETEADQLGTPMTANRASGAHSRWRSSSVHRSRRGYDRLSQQ